MIDPDMRRGYWWPEYKARERERNPSPRALAVMASIPRDVSAFVPTKRERLELGR